MTCIVTRFKTKVQMKAAVQALNLPSMDTGASPHDFWIDDPSIFSPKPCMASAIKEGEEKVVTNHPKRSWFAQIGRKQGKLYVK